MQQKDGLWWNAHGRVDITREKKGEPNHRQDEGMGYHFWLYSNKERGSRKYWVSQKVNGLIKIHWSTFM